MSDLPSGAELMFGDFAPQLVHCTDDVLFGEVWERSAGASGDKVVPRPDPTLHGA